MKNIQHSTAEARPAIQLPRWARPCFDWMLSVEGWLLNVPKLFLILAIRVYQLTVSPLQTYLFGPTGGCRYTPSCSAYAMEALREHGVAAGTFLAAKRICRCHPWGGCGHDPVPQKMTNDEYGASQFLANLSRSEEMTVAVGFIPRTEASTPARRGATVEDSASRVFQSSLRDENPSGSGFRGMNPTATVKSRSATCNKFGCALQGPKSEGRTSAWAMWPAIHRFLKTRPN